MRDRRKQGRFVVSDQGAYGCGAGVQPRAHSAGGVILSSVHRPGLRLQRLQLADDQAHRNYPSAPSDWKLAGLGWIFSLAIFFLGASAVVLVRWVEEGGPRRAEFTAGLCWGRRLLFVGDRGSISTSFGWSISATVCSAGLGSASATSLRCRL